MSIFDGIGTIREFYLDQLEYPSTINEPDFLVNAAAQVLKKYGGKNWVPIIIKNIGEDKYEVIGNSFVYAVAKSAKLETILCIVIESTDEAEEISKILSKEVHPKINLSIANEHEIKAAFEYLKSQSNSPLSNIKPNSIKSIANKIVNSDRQYWTDLTPLGSLRSKPIKENLEFVSKLFYLTSIQPPAPPIQSPALPKINLSIANKDEIKAAFKYLKSQSNSPLSNIQARSIESIANKIVNSDRQYWTDLTPLGNLGTSTNLIKENLEFISMVFYLTPIPPSPPPKINLSIASKDEIKATFEYLKSQSNSPLSKITASSIESIANKVVNSDRQYWTDLTPLGNLGTNLIKENLEFISNLFYLTPIQPPAPPKINLSIANRDQIIEGLEFLKKERKLNIDVLDASTKLEQAEKTYWINYKGVLDLKIKVTENKLDDFKSVFSLKPELLELPNNIDTLPIKKLKEIVKKMGLFRAC
jgi:hypothetical protein